MYTLRVETETTYLCICKEKSIAREESYVWTLS